MACSLGIRKMAAMERHLASGSFSQTIAGGFGREKSIAEYICRELREADEANLLDEEGMHVYGLKPMSDPLQLVCCNACKKPIKESQFAAHAELCRSLKFTEQTILELDGSVVNQRPPRKEKKKLSTSYANQATVVRGQGRSESMDTIGVAGSESHLNRQIRVTSFSNEGKACVDATLMMDDMGVNPGNRDHPASMIHHPTKRHKFIASSHLPLAESPGTESGATNENSTDGITGRDMLGRAVSEHGEPDRKIPELVHKQHLTKKDFPAPLATKIYYSQRNNRLRATLCHLYFEDSSKELCNDVATPQTSNVEMIALQDSHQRDPPCEKLDDVLSKESQLPSLGKAQNSGHILAKNSEIFLQKSAGLCVDNVSRSAATHVGLTRSKFLPKSYSFANNTGKQPCRFNFLYKSLSFLVWTWRGMVK